MKGTRRGMAEVETVMLSDLDIYRAAHATIKRYGDEAGIHAANAPTS